MAVTGRSNYVFEGLPGFAIITADVGAIGAGGDPGFEGFRPLHGGAVAVGRVFRTRNRSRAQNKARRFRYERCTAQRIWLQIVSSDDHEVGKGRMWISSCGKGESARALAGSEAEILRG